MAFPNGQTLVIFTLTLPEELLAELDSWDGAQRPIPIESLAVAELLRQALERWRKEQERKGKRR